MRRFITASTFISTSTTLLYPQNPMEAAAELLLFAGPEMGHLLAEVELGRRLVALDSRISIAILIPKLPVPNENLDASIKSLDADLRLDATARQIELVELPPLDNLPPDWAVGGHVPIVDLLACLYKPIVKRIAEERSRRLRLRTAGIVFDMFCSPMVDVAEDLGVPSYLFFTSGANMLSMVFQMESLGEPDLASRFAGESPESTPVNVPGFRTPVPKKVWPVVFVDKMLSPIFMSFVPQYRRAKGILVNTFAELESDLLLALSSESKCKNIIPPVYSVGPILHLGGGESSREPILSWLDEQPTASVVFLCFGSKVGSFEKAQVEQLANGLELSGHRFIWALRASPLEEILPEGFLERTTGVGKVIEWAPQTEILAHQAVGAFVSHCGWNSVLESLWFGVPVVAWPMYAEQQLNAFLLVKELGLAVDLRMDYVYDMKEKKGNVVVSAEEVEVALRRAMEEEEGAVVRRKVKEVSKLARKAAEVGGSSLVSLSRFADDLF